MERKRNADGLDKILIVEDSPVQAEKLKYSLETHGFHVIAANDGLQALKILKDGYRPFLIISDILMPEMDGYEFCRRLRQDKHLKDIPVILLTTLSDMKDVIKGLECGANNFITKPYDEDHLISRIQQLRESLTLRESFGEEGGIRVFFSGEHNLITADPSRVLDLLLSTYENACLQNSKLLRTQNELIVLNEELDRKVTERTAHLNAEITERKKAEKELNKRTEELHDMTQQLWQAAKLATMGELAASIAHELNNPLATASLRVESLLAKTQADSPNRRELEIVEQEIERMGVLVANLLQFSRRTQKQISTLDVCEEIEKTLELIYYHLRKYKIAVVREFAPDVPRIHADRQQLRQLFLNLFTNAGDAMPRGGTLTIRVTAPLESGQIIIEVADTGTGIPPEILPKVTEPFYTTKAEGKGTGLGLSICRRIVEEHNGTFDLTSEGIPGRGTTARISLPVINNKTNAGHLKGR